MNLSTRTDPILRLLFLERTDARSSFVPTTSLWPHLRLTGTSFILWPKGTIRDHQTFMHHLAFLVQEEQCFDHWAFALNTPVPPDWHLESILELLHFVTPYP